MEVLRTENLTADYADKIRSRKPTSQSLDNTDALSTPIIAEIAKMMIENHNSEAIRVYPRDPR